MSNQRNSMNTSDVSKEPKGTVSIIIPFYNEEGILENTFQKLIDYLATLDKEYHFEILLVDDGSNDHSAEIAKRFEGKNSSIRILTHHINLGLGHALQTGFNHSTGKYVIVLDADLSYSLDHIETLLQKLVKNRAKVVIASPYMENGKVSNVPWTRFQLSRWANRFLCFLYRSPVKTLTGMVRGYDGNFIRNLSLRSTGPEINLEIVYKAAILENQIEEIPAHLSWIGEETKKRSKLKIVTHTSNTVFFGFLMKPVLFFILPGIIVLLFAIYTSAWMVIHFFEEYAKMQSYDQISDAFKAAYNLNPHTFIMAFISMILAVQFISAGLQSLQSKHYFEELFSLGTKILQKREKK